MLTISGESLRNYSWWLSDTPSTDWPDLPGTCVLGRHSDLSPIRIALSEIGPDTAFGETAPASDSLAPLTHFPNSRSLSPLLSTPIRPIRPFRPTLRATMD